MKANKSSSSSLSSSIPSLLNNTKSKVANKFENFHQLAKSNLRSFTTSFKRRNNHISYCDELNFTHDSTNTEVEKPSGLLDERLSLNRLPIESSCAKLFSVEATTNNDQKPIMIIDESNLRPPPLNMASSNINILEHLNYFNIKLASTSAARITYKSPYFMPMAFFLIAFTLLPIQYHAENFGIQMKKMLDSCADSAGFFNENQTHILDTLFPYGFGNGVSGGFEQLAQELAVIDEIHRRQALRENNLTIKYLTQAECLRKNYTGILNLITIASPSSLPKSVKHSPLRVFEITDDMRQRYAISRQQVMFHQLPKSNVILVCDDDSYKKSLFNAIKQSGKMNLDEIGGSTGLDGKLLITNQNEIDFLDFQTNVLTQWNISCKNLSTSTVTISYAQMTFLSGEIIGSIFFSMLADYIGRKKVYLSTLYISTVVGAFVSLCQTYKQFIIFRFPIAALVQGCFIVSYVLLFELILKSKNRNIYCSLFISTQYFFNLLIANASRMIADWRYMQLAGSLVSTFAIGYPWLITESFKWLCVKEDFAQAERVCKRVFKENGVIARLMKMKASDDQKSNAAETTTTADSSSASATAYWPMVIWQPTFRKIICYFVLMWSILSLTYFFISEEDVRLTPSHVGNYMVHNFMLALSNTMLGIIYYKMGKRFPLGSCMLLGGAFYLASSLISQDLNAQWLKLTFHLISKVLVNCSINILMFFVCELFPCEIRCSSFSFFLSIKHLSEMFAIYIFKVNLLPMSVIRIGLAIFCMLLCIFAFLLPERSAFSFNLDYLEYLNNRNKLRKNFPFATTDSTTNESTPNKKALSYPNDFIGNFLDDIMNQQLQQSQHQQQQQQLQHNNYHQQQQHQQQLQQYHQQNRTYPHHHHHHNHLHHPYQFGDDSTSTSRFMAAMGNFQSTVNTNHLSMEKNLSDLDLLNKTVEECETKLLANTLIKKINCENHCKTGKLNPLYEEDVVVVQQQNQRQQQQHFGLVSTISNGSLNQQLPNQHLTNNANNTTPNFQMNAFFNETSTKF